MPHAPGRSRGLLSPAFNIRNSVRKCCFGRRHCRNIIFVFCRIPVPVCTGKRERCYKVHCPIRRFFTSHQPKRVLLFITTPAWWNPGEPLFGEISESVMFPIRTNPSIEAGFIAAPQHSLQSDYIEPLFFRINEFLMRQKSSGKALV